MKRMIACAIVAALVVIGFAPSPSSAVEIAEIRGDFYYDREGRLVGHRNADLPEGFERRPMSHREKFDLMGLELPPAPRALEPRALLEKPAEIFLQPGQTRTEVMVKFRDEVPVRMRQGRLQSGLMELEGMDAVLADFPEAAVERVFDHEERIYDENRETGQILSGRALPDLNNWYLVRLPSESAGIAFGNRVLALDTVETAHFNIIGSDPQCADVAPVTPLYEASQRELNPAPNGLDAEFAWTYHAGGDGYGSSYWIIDAERTWCTTHEDLDFDASDILNGETGGWYSDHGTAVLGIYGACDNGYGVTGMTSDVTLKAIDHNSETSDAAAIAEADLYAVSGEIVLLETHIPGPSTGGTCPCNCSQYEYVPLEWLQANYDAIETAVANGIIMVEAGGNGSVDLDNAVYGNVFQRWFRDSGAILVGASNTDHTPSCFTNHGNRMDVHGYGQSVYSTGYGGLWGQTGCSQDYTATFSGTSSASPQIVGACASTQGVAKLKYGVTLSPDQMRTIIQVGGTPQGAPAANIIGPMPDLADVLNALEPDLISSYTPPGWSYPAVPRSANNSTGGSVVLQSSALPGNVNSTWFNWNMRNESDYTPSSDSLECRIFLDESSLGWCHWDGSFAPNSWSYCINAFQRTVKGGRHTVRTQADTNDEEEESSETNNEWSRQYIWSPLALSPDVPLSRTDDPHATSTGYGPYYNAEGFSGTTSSQWWHAFAVMPQNSGDDFDIRLNSESPSNIPVQGFGATEAASFTGAGEIAFVVWDRNETPSGTYYASVLNFSGPGSSNKTVEYEHDAGFLVEGGVAGPFTIGNGDLIELHQDCASAGTWLIEVEVLSGNADYGISFFDTEGGYFHKTNTYPGGYADNVGPGENEVIVVEDLVAGCYGLAVWKKGTADLSQTLTYNVHISSMPNLTYHTPSGWYGPVVPRNTTDATPTFAPLPATLTGNQTTTSFNWAGINAGAGIATAPWKSRLFVDDFSSWLQHGASIPTGTTRIVNNTTQGLDPFSLVRGGRHYLRNEWDADLELAEYKENDNRWVDWFVWTPLQLADHVPVTRSAPPTATPIGYSWYTHDGFRTLPGGGFWHGVAICPVSGTDDYDLRLYDPSTGSKDGFGSGLFSSTGAGLTTLSLVDYNKAVNQAYDWGAINIPGGTGDFVAQKANSPLLASDPVGVNTYGVFDLPPNELLDVFEVWLNPNVVGPTLFVDLENLAGNANLQMAVYGLASDGKYGMLSSLASAQAGGNGADEHLELSVTAADYYAIAVWKNGAADLAKDVRYNLWLSTTQVVDAPAVEAAPDRFALAAPRPNPFSQGTVIRYDVPAQGGSVRIGVYDLSGRRVQTLVDGAQPAGRHSVSWDGRDTGGSRVGAGVYFVRFETPAGVETRKITRLR